MASQGPPSPSEKSSEVHTSKGGVEGICNAIDSAVELSREQTGSQPSQTSGSRAAIFVVFVLSMLGGVTYMFVDWYRKRELKLEAMETPRLVHAVDEVQGWRKANYIAVVIMAFTGAGVMLAAVFFRRYRAEKARNLDSTYWGLAISSIFTLGLYILYRIRQRRRKALRKALEYAAKHPSRLKHKIIGALLVIFTVGLLWYRRRVHALHIKRKKTHMESIRPADNGHIEVMPKEPVLKANQDNVVKRASPGEK